MNLTLKSIDMIEEYQNKTELEKKQGLSNLWVITFADLMSLLMCFFVLLLSYSEMDLQKFKMLSGSMQNAFGVQRDVRANEIPRGISIIKKEFSPGITKDTDLNKVKQDSVQTELKKLVVEENANQIALELQQEIKQGTIELETHQGLIVIHILEKDAFQSGLAELEPTFLEVMKKVKKVLRSVNGQIKVSGHTDDIPISNKRFRSNWELSAARAVSVVHEILKDEFIDPRRLEVSGYADQHPLALNDSHAGRARNRRVDIAIIQEEK